MEHTHIAPLGLAAIVSIACNAVPGAVAVAADAVNTREATEGTPLPNAKPSPSALFHAAYYRAADQWQPVLFLCDGIGGDRVTLISTPDAKGQSILRSYRKPGLRTDSVAVRMGDEDHGAGQVMREIRRLNGTAFGAVHSVNPGMLGDADATTLPTLSSITDAAGTTRCRWMPRARILYVDTRRSVLVTAAADGNYTYRSFDHARPGKRIEMGGGGTTSTATATIRGGRLVRAGRGQEVYLFEAGPWTYRLTASADNRAPGARLTVLRAGRPVQSSIATAYQMAAKRIE